MIILDSRNLRAGTYAGIVLLLVGFVFGNFGGWTAIFGVSRNIFGVWVLGITFSIALAYVYNTWFANFLPGTTLIRGVFFGLLVWIAFLILGGLSNFFKDSVYGPNNSSILFTSLVTSIIWGAMLSLFSELKS